MTGSQPRRRRGRVVPSAGPPRNATPTQARIVAVRVLERVERAGAYADLALGAALNRSDLAPRDRAFVTELVYGTLRWRGHLDALLRPVLDRPPERLEALVRTLLRVGTYQIVFEGGVPDSAAVDQTVRCARALGVSRAAGLVNGVLRSLARGHEAIELPSLEEDPLAHLMDVLSIPAEIAQPWIDELGPTEAAALASASNRIPPMIARVNRTLGSRDALMEELHERIPDLSPCRFSADGIRLGHLGFPAHDPAFMEGRFSIQDEASQLVVDLLDPQPGERILDTCAAPGSKACAIAERIGAAGKVDAWDRHGRRLALVTRNVRRLGLDNLAVREFDATRPFPEAPPYDRILVDAPCSGLGTLRRNPDARWRFDTEAVARLVEVQRALLARAAEAVRPGGMLVYSTCTLRTEENEQVVAGFLEQQEEFAVAPRASVPVALHPLLQGDGSLRTWPHRHDTDGFYAVRLERKA